MFGFTPKKTMNEIASDTTIIDVDVDLSDDAVEGEDDPTGTIVLDMNSMAAMVVDPKPPTTITQLEKSSLHTTCSDASINIDAYRLTNSTKDSVTPEDGEELSFCVSQLENCSDVLGDGTGLDLTLRPDGDNDGASEVKDDSKVADISPSSDDAKHAMETLITVSQQLLKSTPPTPRTTHETTKHVSILKQYKFFVIFAMVVGGLAQNMNRSMDVYVTLSYLFSAWTQPLDRFMIREDNINLVVGDLTYRKEEMNSSSISHNLGLWHVIVLGMMAKLALATTKKCDGPVDTVGSDEVGSNEIGCFTSEVNTTSAGRSLQGSAPVKLQHEDRPVVEIKCDLSKYEKLTVMELRALLRSRKCTYDGRKVHLIQRLASVYRAELESMTVVQLRRRLKSKHMKQGGLKSELVQKLLEAGL